MELIKPIGKTGKIGLFFGSFNPITNGHLRIGEKSLEHGLDELWFMVSPHNPHKFKTGVLAHENHRWEMVNLALKNVESKNIFASNLEFFHEKKPSFTHITLQKLRADNPEAQLIIVCGTDTHHKIQIWKEGKWIHENFDFYVFPRGEDGHKPVKNKVLHNNSVYLDAVGESISATDIRNALERQEPIIEMTPQTVADYISQNNVY